MKTINDFNEAMKDPAMQQEFKAFLEEKNPEDKEALAKAVMEFAAAKGVEATTGKRELSLEDLDEVSGGRELTMDQWDLALVNYAPAFRGLGIAIYNGILGFAGKKQLASGKDVVSDKEIGIRTDPILDNFANC